MAGSQQLELWFGNQSSAGGKVCVYQPTGNATFNGTELDQLAWMVTGANPDVWVRFLWTVDYDFVWIDQGPTRSLQVERADLQGANQTTLSSNQYGFSFSNAVAGTPAGTVLIGEDGSVPVQNNVVAGIGMSGAGTLATPAKPNQNLAFTPVAEASLSYRITFGQYSFDVGDVITPTTLNPSATVSFASGVTVVTATLDASNTWHVSDGVPPDWSSIKNDVTYKTYRAGVGLVSSG